MSVFDRLSNVFKGAVSLRLNAMETRNPEAVYAAAIEGGTERAVELKQRIAGLIGTRNKAEEEVRSAERELEQLARARAAAASEGEEDVFIVLEYQHGELTRRRDEALARMEGLAVQVEEGKSALMAFRAELEALKREQTSMLAKKELAAARIVAHDTQSGLSEDADVVALGKVRDAVEALESRAHGDYLDREGNPIRAKVEAVAQKSAEQRAREELARLKAQLRGGDDDDES